MGPRLFMVPIGLDRVALCGLNQASKLVVRGHLSVCERECVCAWQLDCKSVNFLAAKFEKMGFTS